MSVSIVIMAHPARSGRANRLAAELGAAIAFDYGTGQNLNSDYAWRLAASKKADWSIVLEDDALPVPDFRVHAERALEEVSRHRPPLVSFYTGTGSPRAEKVSDAVRAADAAGHSWLRCDALLWGVGVALSSELIPAMLASVATHPKTRYDTRLGQWANGQGMQILYTNPSLVDHADTQSLLGHSREGVLRRAHRVGVPEDWHTSATQIAGRFPA